MQGVLDGLPIGLVLLAGIFAPLSGWFAAQRFRQPIVWFALGALIGPFAIGLLALAPPGRCPVCDEPVHGWAEWCQGCGAHLRGGAATRDPFAEQAAVAVAAPAAAGARGQASLLSPPPASPWSPPPAAAPVPQVPRRPQATSFESSRSSSEPTAGEILATGVYLSGNAGLEIGATYALARDGDHLRVFGPVDAGQLTVRHEGPLEDFEITAMDDRVIITGRRRRSPLAIIMRMVGGMRAAELERAFAPAEISQTRQS